MYMRDALCIVIILILLVLLTRKKERDGFLGVNPNSVVRILEVAPNATNHNYKSFSEAIYPASLHPWAFEEIQALSAVGAVTPLAVQQILELNQTYWLRPPFMRSRAQCSRGKLDNSSEFVHETVSKTGGPMWIVGVPKANDSYVL